MPVSMGDSWYENSSVDHFWVQRRFAVLQSIGGRLIERASSLAEVGCGHGLLQRQIEDAYSREVAGFDLNELALKQTVSRVSPVCCYDVFQRDADHAGRFDLIFLFDVLEHLQDEDAFLSAVRFHLAPGGRILINVPAIQALWSKYDEAAGHFRRYNIAGLRRVAERNEMSVSTWSYWGLPLMPLLIARKLWFYVRSPENVISTGFSKRNDVLNRLLLGVSRCERIPQHLLGSSLMAVLDGVTR
jgi:SAM-dependent methyltransferase